MPGSPDRTSFILGRVNVSPSDTQGGSRVPELGPLGSVRGALSNGRPYRDLRVMRSLLHSLALARTSLATSLSEVGAGDGIVGCGSSLGLKLAASSAATAGGTSPAFR